jgi:hypothetical protein
MHTQLQLASASRMAQVLALADAHQKSGELFAAMDDFRRALKGLQACGAAKDFLWDQAAGARDELVRLSHAIDTDLDEQGLCPMKPLDFAELDAFLESVK